MESLTVLTVNPPEGAPIVSPQSNANGSSELQLEPDESRDFAVAMARIAHETKGSDIMVLHVAPLIYWTSYMVGDSPCTGACTSAACARWRSTLNPAVSQYVPGVVPALTKFCNMSAGFCYSLLAAAAGCSAGQDGEGGR